MKEAHTHNMSMVPVAYSVLPASQVVWLLVLLLVVLLAAWEQLTYLRKAKHLCGPRFVVAPLVGSIFPLVWNPTRFWEQEAANASRTGLGMSWNALLGRFTIFLRDSELSHKVFANVRTGVFQMYHPLGSNKLFGDKNILLMSGEEHKDLRRRIAPLFCPSSLAIYIPIQERIVRMHISKWLSGKDPSIVELRPLLLEMNLETSQDVFVGPYLDAAAGDRLRIDYQLSNNGLMSLPIDLPGFAYRKAREAVQRINEKLSHCVAASKRKMAAGDEPQCMLDVWMMNEQQEAGGSMDDREAASHLFNFLNAAQDTNMSALVWTAALLESHPAVLEAVREEQRRVRPDPTSAMTAEQLREMVYTSMVVKEVLRYRPPAPAVPHIANTDFAISETYTVPKGSVVFASLLESSMQGFTNAARFDPERFSEQRQEDVHFKSNWLVFGAGSHQCVGQRYAFNQLVLFIALFSMSAEWKRIYSPHCDDITYTPSICPRDGCVVQLGNLPSP